MAAVHQCDFCGGVSGLQPYAVTIDDNKQQRDRIVATFDMCARCHGALEDWRVARLRSDGQVAIEGADASLSITVPPPLTGTATFSPSSLHEAVGMAGEWHAGSGRSPCGKETRDPQSRVVSLCALPMGHAGACEA